MSTQKAPDDKYTDPALRARLKDEVQAGDKGGKPGQWSARKAQVLKHEYEKAGGGYRGEKDERQQHLSQWSGEDWQTSDGSSDATTGDEPDGAGASKRYLPKQAWDELSEEERATDAKKARGAERGEQHVANTDAAARAGRQARDHGGKHDQSDSRDHDADHAGAGDGGDEPLDGYDDLTAAEVVGQVGDLDDGQRRAVRDYERSHAGRKTVLERVDRALG